MTTSVALKIILKAGETVVAESENPALWQQVLAAITAPTSPNSDSGIGIRSSSVNVATGSSEVDKMAAEVGVSSAVLIGACAPSAEPPYMHLDLHCWETLKKSTPARGRGAVSAMSLAATALCLWFKHSKRGSPTPAQVQAVLKTIEVAEANPTRAISNCDWLQPRAGGIVLNPAEISTALRVVREFCTRQYGGPSAL